MYLFLQNCTYAKAIDTNHFQTFSSYLNLSCTKDVVDFTDSSVKYCAIVYLEENGKLWYNGVRSAVETLHFLNYVIQLECALR